jgi:hypothetical protein
LPLVFEQAICGIPPHDVRLTYGREKLQSGRTLGSYHLGYHITGRAGQQTVTLTPETITVKMCTMQGKTFALEVRKEDTLEAVVRRLNDLNPDFDLDADSYVRMFWNGREIFLRDDDKIQDYGIRQGDQIHFVYHYKGGGCGPNVPRFANVSNFELLTPYAFSDRAPEWRRTTRGLNVEGVCKNRGCSAHGQMVICPLGFATFNISRQAILNL